MPLPRRTFLKTAGALTALGGAAAAEDRFRKPIGAELYTVRKLLTKDADGTLKRIEDIGYTEVESMRADMPRLRPLFEKYRLSCPSVHFETGLITGRRDLWHLSADDSWDQAVQQAKDWHLEYMVIPYLMPPERKDYAAFVDKLNQAGEACNKAGVGLCYHHHAFEFGGEPGKRPIDLFLERTDPKLVNLESDVFWVSVSGNDPVEFLQRHGDRVKMLHLKDKAKGTPVMAAENVPARDFKEVGNGVLNFPAILREAEKIDVRHYFVEQDETPGDPVESLRQSYRYLRSVTL
ncbi:MAG TPA: sugar phosphate isomerase/epimerase [Bryobacteraceae bacterium]|nr:sugar phosphate isomerase/epimerase [Bryobacteraceae bacterium]